MKRRWLVGLLACAATARAVPPNLGVADRLTKINRATPWKEVAAIKLPFRTFHPQGMLKIGDEFFLSSVEVRREPKKLDRPTDGHAYDAGVGVGHLFKFNRNGTLIADLLLGEGSIYHPGGIDYDGTSIWVPVAEYRPNSRTIVYTVAPGGMNATEAFRISDHIGGIVHDRVGHRIIGLDWGSRHFYAWPVLSSGAVASASAVTTPNIESYIDYQDCHAADERRMLCSGVADYKSATMTTPFSLGGLELLDTDNLRPIWQTPIPLWSPSGRAMTQNPSWIEATKTGVRAYFIPDDDNSTMFVYEANTRR